MHNYVLPLLFNVNGLDKVKNNFLKICVCYNLALYFVPKLRKPQFTATEMNSYTGKIEILPNLLVVESGRSNVSVHGGIYMAFLYNPTNLKMPIKCHVSKRRFTETVGDVSFSKDKLDNPWHKGLTATQM